MMCNVRESSVWATQRKKDCWRVDVGYCIPSRALYLTKICLSLITDDWGFWKFALTLIHTPVKPSKMASTPTSWNPLVRLYMLQSLGSQFTIVQTEHIQSEVGLSGAICSLLRMICTVLVCFLLTLIWFKTTSQREKKNLKGILPAHRVCSA